MRASKPCQSHSVSHASQGGSYVSQGASYLSHAFSLNIYMYIKNMQSKTMLYVYVNI